MGQNELMATTRPGTHGALVALTEMITDGRLAPGSKLPIEPDLSEQLGVSRTTLREAVRALAFAGALDVRQGDGTYVTASDPARVFGGLGLLSAAASDESMLAVVEARRVVEPQLASLAAERRDQADLDAIGKELTRMEDAATVEDLVAADVDFHCRVAKAARSPVLEHFLNNLSSRTLFARVWHGVEEDERNSRAIHAHHLILSAIEARDSDLAAAHALAHIAGLEAWLGDRIAAGRD